MQLSELMHLASGADQVYIYTLAVTFSQNFCDIEARPV